MSNIFLYFFTGDITIILIILVVVTINLLPLLPLIIALITHRILHLVVGGAILIEVAMATLRPIPAAVTVRHAPIILREEGAVTVVVIITIVTKEHCTHTHTLGHVCQFKNKILILLNHSKCMII